MSATALMLRYIKSCRGYYLHDTNRRVQNPPLRTLHVPVHVIIRGMQRTRGSGRVRLESRAMLAGSTYCTSYQTQVEAIIQIPAQVLSALPTLSIFHYYLIVSFLMMESRVRSSQSNTQKSIVNVSSITFEVLTLFLQKLNLNPYNFRKKTGLSMLYTLQQDFILSSACFKPDIRWLYGLQEL